MHAFLRSLRHGKGRFHEKGIPHRIIIFRWKTSRLHVHGPPVLLRLLGAVIGCGQYIGDQGFQLHPFDPGRDHHHLCRLDNIQAACREGMSCEIRKKRRHPDTGNAHRLVHLSPVHLHAGGKYRRIDFHLHSFHTDVLGWELSFIPVTGVSLGEALGVSTGEKGQGLDPERLRIHPDIYRYMVHCYDLHKPLTAGLDYKVMPFLEKTGENCLSRSTVPGRYPPRRVNTTLP